MTTARAVTDGLGRVTHGYIMPGQKAISPSQYLSEALIASREISPTKTEKTKLKYLYESNINTVNIIAMKLLELNYSFETVCTIQRFNHLIKVYCGDHFAYGTKSLYRIEKKKPGINY